MNGRKAKERRRQERAGKVAATLASLRIVGVDGLEFVQAGDALLALPEYALLRKANPHIPFPSLAEISERTSK